MKAGPLPHLPQLTEWFQTALKHTSTIACGLQGTCVSDIHVITSLACPTVLPTLYFTPLFKGTQLKGQHCDLDATPRSIQAPSGLPLFLSHPTLLL